VGGFGTSSSILLGADGGRVRQEGHGAPNLHLWLPNRFCVSYGEKTDHLFPSSLRALGLTQDCLPRPLSLCVTLVSRLLDGTLPDSVFQAKHRSRHGAILVSTRQLVAGLAEHAVSILGSRRLGGPSP
jgi:hypothetical protein